MTRLTLGPPLAARQRTPRSTGRAGLALLLALAAGCRTAAPHARAEEPEVAPPEEAPAEPSAPDPEEAPEQVHEEAAEEAPVERDPSAPMTTFEAMSKGIVLRNPEENPWGAHLLLPVSIGLTEFEFGEFSLDNLTTISVVPTVEALFPLGSRWYIGPFVGLGLAAQLGAGDLVGDDDVVGLATGGLRAEAWYPFEERWGVSVTGKVRYDAVLTPRNGVLGDWGSLDASVELRHAFGSPRPGPRFQLGAYLLGTHYWDPVELEIDGVTPRSVDNQGEVGLSLGSTRPWKILGIAVPRTYLGIRVGEGLRSLRIRFGRL
jgi:hypothetical protein